MSEPMSDERLKFLEAKTRFWVNGYAIGELSQEVRRLRERTAELEVIQRDQAGLIVEHVKRLVELEKQLSVSVPLKMRPLAHDGSVGMGGVKGGGDDLRE